jgi:hypothetical protein
MSDAVLVPPFSVASQLVQTPTSPLNYLVASTKFKPNEVILYLEAELSFQCDSKVVDLNDPDIFHYL